MADLAVLLDGLHFPGGPRWRDGRRWFSDFDAHEVVAVGLDGRRETIVKVPEQPSGLGWLPDGRLLVVSMKDRKVMRLDPDGLKVHADLWDLAAFNCNDMIVDRSEEHTSELQSLMRISYAVFCLKKKKNKQ